MKSSSALARDVPSPLMPQPLQLLEALEARIAPASFTFTDVDGDLVTVSTSKGSAQQLEAALFFNTPADVPRQLERIDFTGDAQAFAGTTLSVVAQRGPNGDGFVNVGSIIATGIDLGAVKIRGDLGQIIAGDTNLSTNAVASLTVSSLGNFGTTTGGSPGLESTLTGVVGNILIQGDLRDAVLKITGDGAATGQKIGSITVGGSVLGDVSGRLIVSDDVGTLKIGGNIVAGQGFASAQIAVSGHVGKFSIGGSLIGGDTQSPQAGISPGTIIVNSFSSFTLGGSLIGGESDGSGTLSILGTVGNTKAMALTVGGSLIGGEGDRSGSISLFGSEPIKVLIKGDIKGDAGKFSGNLTGGVLSSLTVGGSLIGGEGLAAGVIFPDSVQGKIAIGGDVRGGDGSGSGGISAATSSAGIAIGGSVLAGSGDQSGRIQEVGASAVVIRGDLTGGVSSSGTEGLRSVLVGGTIRGGAISSIGTADFFRVTGSVIGADGFGSGSIAAAAKSVAIGGSLLGGGGQDSGTLNSALGSFGSVSIGGDIIGGSGKRSGGLIANDLGSLTIGGSIIGGQGIESARVSIEKGATSFTLGGSIVGGAALSSGSVSLGVSAAPGEPVLAKAISIGGSLLGGKGAESGSLDFVDAGSVLIKGNIQGGSGVESGLISGGNIGKFVIGGSVLGGTAPTSGSLFLADVRTLSIGGDIRGGSASSGDLFDAGSLFAGNVVKASLGGSLFAGTNLTAGAFENNGVMRFEGSVKSLAVKGSLVGNATNEALITAIGELSPSKVGINIAFGSLSIGGSVESTRILAGYGISGSTINGIGGLNADAQIGKVTVGGDWIRSSIAAGASDGGLGFGDPSNTSLPGGVADTISKIASIAIRGLATGSVTPLESVGFVAQEIGALSIGGSKFPLATGASNDVFNLGPTTLVLREL